MSMLEIGRLDPAYCVIPMPGGDIQLRAENGHMLILRCQADHKAFVTICVISKNPISESRWKP